MLDENKLIEWKSVRNGIKIKGVWLMRRDR